MKEIEELSKVLKIEGERTGDRQYQYFYVGPPSYDNENRCTFRYALEKSALEVVLLPPVDDSLLLCLYGYSAMPSPTVLVCTQRKSCGIHIPKPGESWMWGVGYLPNDVKKEHPLAIWSVSLVPQRAEEKALMAAVENKAMMNKIMPYVKAIPAVIAQRDEAIEAPLEMADDLRRQWPLTPEEDKIRSLLCRMTGKQASEETGICESNISRLKTKIRGKLLAFGVPEKSIFMFRPSAGYKAVIQGKDEATGEFIKEIAAPDKDWREDVHRERTLKQYHAANPDQRTEMRTYYADIEAEYESWMKSR